MCLDSLSCWTACWACSPSRRPSAPASTEAKGSPHVKGDHGAASVPPLRVLESRGRLLTEAPPCSHGSGIFPICQSRARGCVIYGTRWFHLLREERDRQRQRGKEAGHCHNPAKAIWSPESSRDLGSVKGRGAHDHRLDSHGDASRLWASPNTRGTSEVTKSKPLFYREES